MSEPRYFEDFKIGEEFVSAQFTFTPTDVIGFRRLYGGPLGSATAEDLDSSRLSVDLAQLLPTSFRLFYDTGATVPCGRGSPGMNEVRYLNQVYSGDTIRVIAKVRELRPSSSSPQRGTAEIAFSVLNQRGETVLSFLVLQLLGRRTAQSV